MNTAAVAASVPLPPKNHVRHRIDWTALFGYDLFISYRRDESSGFAAALTQDLAELDFTCFLDRADAPAGMRLEPHIRRALHRSKILVVIVTSKAPDSPWVTLEVEEFLAARPGPIIPIDVNRRYLSLAADDTPWGRLRRLNLITAEATPEEIASGRPSPDLARTIAETYGHLKANARRRIATTVIAATLIATSAFAVWKAVQATRSAVEAQRQQRAALSNAREANVQQQNAKRNAEEADRQRQSAEGRLYVSQMSLALQNWTDHNVGSLPGLLEASRPGPSSPDLRGWEWYYLFGLAHTSKTKFEPLDGQIISVAWSQDGELIAAATATAISIWRASDKAFIVQIPALNCSYSALCWSADSQLLAGMGENQVLVWRRSNGSVRRWQNRGTANFPGWRASRFLLGIANGKITTWDLQTGEISVGADVGRKLAVWNDDGRLAVAFRGTYGTPHHDHDSPPAVLILDSTGRELTLQGFESDPPEQAEITAMAWKQNSDTLSIAAVDKHIEFWDVNSERKESGNWLTGHEGIVRDLAWNSGGLLASASDDQTVRIWDPSLRAATRVLRGHEGAVISVRWNGTGTLLASGGYDRAVRLWSAAAEDGPKPFLLLNVSTPATDQMEGENLSMRSFVWAPDGRRIVAVGTGFFDDAPITATMIFSMEGEPGVVDGPHEDEVFWRPDGRRFVSPDGLNLLSVFDSDTGREVLKLRGNHGYFREVAWSPDGKRIATAGDDRVIRLWDDATGRPLQKLIAEASRTTQLMWTRDGHYLSTRATNSPSIEVWDTTQGVRTQRLELPTGGPRLFSWSQSARYFANADVDGAVEVWDAVEGRQLRRLPFSGKPALITWSPDSRYVAIFKDKFKVVDVWDPFAGRMVQSLPAQLGWRYVGKWSTTGKYFVATSETGGSMQIWTTLSPVYRPLYTLRSHSDLVSGVDWTPDDRRLASSSRDRTVKIWDMGTGGEVCTLRDQTLGPLTSLAWSPDGWSLAAISNKEDIVVWSAAEGRRLAQAYSINPRSSTVPTAQIARGKPGFGSESGP